MMESLFNYTLENLATEMVALGQKSFRATQIYNWLYQKRVKNIDDMSDIAISFREILKSKYSLTMPNEIRKQVSYDGTVKLLVELEDKTDRYEDALNTYLVKLSGMNLSVHDNRILNTLLYSISDIERMADHAMAVAKAALEMEEKKIEFSNQAKGELAVLEQAVLDIVDRTVAAYGSFDREQAARIEPQEQVVDALVREVKSRHVRRLRDGLCTVEYGFVLEDLLTACERTADHCSNVAVEMLQVAEGKLEAHEYLNALKAGELHESAAFAEQFAQYKARYAFPEEN